MPVFWEQMLIEHKERMHWPLFSLFHVLPIDPIFIEIPEASLKSL
jgi:hypothetical protein